MIRHVFNFEEPGGKNMIANIHDYHNKHVHFIGIGGSSMSGLAGLLQDEGYIVSGSDKTRSHKTDKLAEADAVIEYADALGRLFCNFIGINMYVNIKNLHKLSLPHGKNLRPL